MTLGQLLHAFDSNYELPLFYFSALPLSALLGLLLSRGNGKESPWKYFYTGLIYMAVIPGIFVIILNIYLVFIEGKSLLNMNLVTQVLPVISMILTLVLIRRAVHFDFIPGFDKLQGFMLIVFVVMVLLWIMEKMHILAITVIPFQFALLLLVGLILLGLWGWRRLSS